MLLLFIFNHKSFLLAEWEVLVMVVKSLFGGNLSLVLCPHFLNRRAVFGESWNSIFGLSRFSVSGTLMKLVAYRVPVLINPVLPRFRVGFAPPRDVGVLQSESERVTTRENHAEPKGAKKRLPRRGLGERRSS